MSAFNEAQFKQKLQNSLTSIKQIVDSTRRPVMPDAVSHSYDDKYELAMFVSSCALAGVFTALEALGVTAKTLELLRKWSHSRSVTLRLAASSTCAFVKETTRKVESEVQNVTKIAGLAKITEKVVTTITEYWWDFEAAWELFAFEGTNVDDKVSVRSRTGKCTLMTTVKSTPQPSSSVRPHVDVEIGWLLRHISPSGALHFSIDRAAKACRTPRRNPEIDSLFQNLALLSAWCTSAHSHFRSYLFPIQPNHSLDLNALRSSSVFVPVVPYFEESSGARPRAAQSNALVLVEEKEYSERLGLFAEVNSYLKEQKSSLSNKISSLGALYKDTTHLITPAEGSFCVIALHIIDIVSLHRESVEYLEYLLYTQLVGALGKELSPEDFIQYMIYHNRLLFKEQFAPKPFCYPIRRPDHYPEGILSIEAHLASGSLVQPLLTVVHRSRASAPMSFDLSAAAQLSFWGDRYLHAFVQHKFSGSTDQKLFLDARTHQFSSYILVLGTIKSATSFDAKHAVILQNKDDLRIPLGLEEIPTPKAFRDAIESLSPEQQRFCKAYRSMQLSSTLFGIVIIQIKPQLEKLLKLPNQSLTKEIQLSEELLKLFIEYQIPSDLLTYSGDMNAPVERKLEMVKRNVKNMMDMVNVTKKEEIVSKAEEFIYEELERPVYKSKMKKTSAPKMRMEKTSAPQRKMESKMRMEKDEAPVMRKKAAAADTRSFAPARSAAPSPAPVVARSAAPAPAPVAAPVVAPTVAQTVPTQKSSQELVKAPSRAEIVPTEDRDLTTVPTELDAKFEALDEDAALHSVILSVASPWTKKFRTSLLSAESTETLDVDGQKRQRDRAFDLLDALSRSGSLEVDCADLHVIVGASHHFDKTVINTVVQDNANPIEKVERSLLILATTVQSLPADELVNPEQLERVSTYSPALFEEGVKKIED